jgi:hypothetical protein
LNQECRETPVGRRRRLTAGAGVLAFSMQRRGGFAYAAPPCLSGGDDPMKLSAHVTVNDLETEHRLLDRQIKKLNHRSMHLTSTERAQVVELKKWRLATKDRLATVGRR